VSENASEPMEALKSIMESLEKTSLWGLGVVTAIAQAAIYSDATIDIPGVKIPRELGGVITFALLCGLNFQLLRLFQLLGHFLGQLNSDNTRGNRTDDAANQLVSERQRGYALLKAHKWIFNPFSETAEWGSAFSDLFGLSLLLLLWWLGLQSGIHLLRSGDPTVSRLTVGYGLLCLYLVFGIMSARVIWHLMGVVGQTKTLMRLKVSLAIASMFVGFFGIGRIFLKEIFLSDSEKAKRTLQALHQEFSDSSFLKAVRIGDEKTADLFLAAGISPNAEDEKGNTALIKASEAGFTDIVRALIKSGAKLNTKSEDYNDTALTVASGEGHPDIVQLLLSAGADIELKGYKDRTPLARACSNGQEEVVKVLLHTGAKLEPRDLVNDTPLISATDGGFHQHGYPGIVKLLISAGADVNPKGGFGTPLGNASEHGDVEIVQTLLKSGADVKTESNRARSPLFAAVLYAARGEPQLYTATVRELVKAGANVNEKTKDGITPLMIAAEGNNTEIVTVLIGCGADVRAKDAQGKSAVDYAAKNIQARIILQKVTSEK
jgi:ankyrin repeat protein